MAKKVLVCQNVTCKQQGSEKVLAALQAQAPNEVEVEPSGCLGQCGNGPMLLVVPDKTWYHRIQPKDVPRIAEQHLRQNRPVASKLYPQAHGSQNSIWVWVIGFGIFLSLCGLLAFMVGKSGRYL
ncbi:MAG: (2Fe-2S) ferredoxin domain-containing protein [Phormidesmis sp.]